MMKSLLTLLVLALALLASPASTLAQNNRPQAPGQLPAQPPSAPASKTEEEYKKKIEDLEKKVSDLQNRVKELMHQNDELRKAAGTGGGASRPVERPAPGASSPLTSPIAMFDALVKDYDAKFAAMPKESQTEVNRLMEAVRAWTREQTRSMRGPGEWTVEVIKANNITGARAAEVTVQVYDRVGNAIGGQDTIPIQMRFAKDMVQGKKYTIKATIAAKPQYNPKRTARGANDEPRFIGPYAEFGFELEIAEVKEFTDSKP